MKLSFASFCLFFLSALFMGCSDNKIVKVEGKFSVAGETVELKKTSVIQIIFYPDSSDPKNVTSFPADFDRSTFTYKINAIPIGKYKVSVLFLDPYPNNDKLKGAFGPKKSPINIELTENKTFDIDIPKPKK